MRNPSLNAYANYETKILPTLQPSCQTLWQTPVITNRQSYRNFSIVITTNIFGSASEHGRNKGCRLLQTFARNTACCQSGVATLAWCKKCIAIDQIVLRFTWQTNVSRRSNRDRGRKAASLSL